MDLKRTPFYQKHAQAKGRLVDFGGWALPLEYGSILGEARAVRSRCGLFDASHMGQIVIKGRDAFGFLQSMVTNDLGSLKKGQMQYNLFLNQKGYVLDDLMVYHLGESFLCVVNAANIDKIFNWLKTHQKDGVEIINDSDNTALLSLQGPDSQLVLEKVLRIDLDEVKYMTSLSVGLEGSKVLISRSGYTGEDGFEIYMAPADALFWWDSIISAGKEYNLQLCGLGSRDILRVEAGYPLYGHEITEEIDPYTASLRWAVKLNKDFMGKDSLVKADSEGIKYSRVGFIMQEKAVPRQGYKLFAGGEHIGRVSSGVYSPNLDKFIGMAFVDKEFTLADRGVEVSVRERLYKARIVKFPFLEIRTNNRFKIKGGQICKT